MKLSGNNIRELLYAAVEQHKAGRLQEAERIYREILSRDPENVDANHLSGVLACQAGEFDRAVTLITKAVKREPGQPVFYNNLGNALKAKGNLQDAVAAYHKALGLKPDFGDAHYNLGNVFMEQGQPADALSAYEKALALMPSSAELFYNLGKALMELARPDEAAAFYRKAVAIKPDYGDALYNLGNVLMKQDQLDGAAACYRRVISLNPGYVQAHNNLGRTLSTQGKLAEAKVCFRKALSIDPEYVEALNNLGTALQDQGFLVEAIAEYRKALAIKPDLAATYNNLGNALKEAGRLAEAADSCRRALSLKPDYAEAHLNLGITLLAEGLPKEALAGLRKALAGKPDYAEAHSSLLFSSNYCRDLKQEEIYEESLRWNEKHALPLLSADPVHGNTREPDRRLRIGYVSPDFRTHSVAYFIEPVIKSHNRENVDIFCYANVKKPDGVTRRMQEAADKWRVIAWQKDAEVVEQIIKDQIDILVDLAGHTGKNRLLVFARMPAPVQVTWLGYPNTTGLTAIDYRLTDAVADPPGEGDRLHSEELVRLEHGFLCYQPDDSAPEVGPLPRLVQDHITFGSFNNLAKCTPEVVKVWAGILSVVPGSHLLLKAQQLEDYDTRERYLKMFIAEGIAPHRVELHNRLPPKEDHLALYNRVDIGLDPFPYNGTTTTCEALWMGVPVVTLRGERHGGRVGASILHRVGLDELVAESVADYVSLVKMLAMDRNRLQELRGRLRGMMRGSALMEKKLFTTTLEDAYRRMWKRWCDDAAGRI